jgi:hypothetical protein
MVANSHANAPDLIIASPFLRAHACADVDPNALHNESGA